MTAEEWLARGLEVIDSAIRQYSPSHVFGMYSGGNDSLVSTFVASKHPAFSGAVHVNTTIGIEETREHVRKTSAEREWKLQELFPPVPYREIVREHGFPGPASHRFMYIRLKERPIRELIRRHKKHRYDHIGLVTGVRQQESARRMGYVQEIFKEPSTSRIWIAPVAGMGRDERDAFIAHFELPRNPVSDLLCMSGECLCGAFAKPGEKGEIGVFFPKTEDMIDEIADEVRAAGRHAEWGVRPPRCSIRAMTKPAGMLCTDCVPR